MEAKSVRLLAGRPRSAPEPVTDAVVVSEDVYRRERAPLLRLAFLLTGSRALAEELVQEAFLRLHANSATVQNPEGFLRTVLTNLCRTQMRRQKLERQHVEPLPRAIEPPEFDETWRAVCRLPFRQRAVITLRYYADLPEAEIAAILDCRLGTVKSAHHRAVDRLRRELQ